MNITSQVIIRVVFMAGLTLPLLAFAGSPDDWVGPYVGLQVGFGQDNSVSLKSVSGSSSNSFDMTGPIGGGQAGYNWAVGPVVVGVEGAALAANVDGSKQCSNSPAPVCGANLEQLYAVKGRLGVPLGNFLLYGTLGAAAGKIEARYEASGIKISDSVYRNGWLAGLGGALTFNYHWNAMADLQYVDFGRNSYSWLGTPVDMKNQFITLHLGVNYRF